MILRNWFVVMVSLSVLGACAESGRPEATGKGNLRGINSIVTSPDVSFLVEERSQGALNYKDSAARRFDDLSYNINFDVILAGNTIRTRIASRAIDVVPNTEYVFALAGSLAAPNLLTFEYPERQWGGSETAFEGRWLHLAASEQDLDIYFAAPGTVPVLGGARASIAYGQVSAPFEVPAGDYELILTSRGLPSAIRYQSRTLTQTAATSVLFGIFDPDPSITGDLSVRIMGSGQGAELADVRFPPTLRLMHSAFATNNVDLYVNNDFATPVVSDLGFGNISADFNFNSTATPVTVAPAGGPPAMFLLESTLATTAGTRNSAFLVGAPANLRLLAFADNHRPVETTGRYRVMHLAANSTTVDLYIYLSSENINDVAPRFFSVPFLSTTGYANLAAGSYQVAITLPGQKNIIGGPLALDLALGQIAELAILDTADPNVFDLLIYDN